MTLCINHGIHNTLGRFRGWFRMVQAQCSVILEMNTQHNSLYFVHFGHQRPSTYRWFLRWFRVVPKLSGVRLMKHIELLARSEDAAPLASLRPSKSASPAFPEALEFAIRGRSGTAPAFETAAPAKHSIWQSKLRSHVLRELELENDCTMSNSICALVLANLPIN